MSKLKFIIILLLASGFGFSQEQMTLEKAIALAMENNYGIQIDETAIQIAENNNAWVKAGKKPTVDINGFVNNNLRDESAAQSFITGTSYVGSAGLSLDAQWLVYNGGRIKISKEQLGLFVEQEKLNFESNLNELIRSVSLAYYNVLFQKESLQLQSANLDLSRDRLAYEITKRDFGSSNEYNILQFENSILTDSLNLITQANLVEVSKRQLNSTINYSDYVDFEFPEKLSLVVEDIDEEKLKASLSEDNYSLKTLEMIANLDALNTAMAESASKPTLSLSSSLGVTESAFKLFGDIPGTNQPSEVNFGRSLSFGIGANLNYNLYDGGNRSIDIQNAKLSQEITQLSLLEAKASLNNQLDILIANYNSQLVQLDLSEQQINLAKRNLEMTEARFKQGQLSSLDFRNVQNQHLFALFARANVIYNLLISKSEIDFLIGKFEN